MEFELTTGNLRKLCLCCLNEGVYNLWEHKICWREDDAETPTLVYETADEVEVDNTEELTVHELLQMFEGWQKLLPLDTALQLICDVCLSELLHCYRFYRRLCATSQQVERLYQQATSMGEESLTARTSTTTSEQSSVYEHDLQEFLKISAPPSAQMAKLQTVYIDALPLKQHEPHKRKVVKNPKLVLTGGVAQLLTHVKDTNSLPIITEASLKRAANVLDNTQKRQRRLEDMHAGTDITDASDCVQYDAAADIASHVMATQSSDTVQPQQHVQLDTADDEAFIVLDTPEDDSAALSVEIAVITEPNVKALEQNVVPPAPLSPAPIDEDAVLAFSTLSADDAGRTIYVCKYCPCAFSAPCFLMTHAHKSHVCKYCTQGYVKSQDLFAHIKEAHQQHKCATCNKEFSTKSNLRAHAKRVHGSNSRLKTLTQRKYSSATLIGDGGNVQAMDNVGSAVEYLG